jgi:next-to-BRCA1 protein 1
VTAIQLKAILGLGPDANVVFERFSDSNGSYVTLSPDEPQVYKTLFRAAKAKLKLRLRATVVGEEDAFSAAKDAFIADVVSAEEQSRGNWQMHAPMAAQAVQVCPIIARSPAPVSEVSTYKKPSVESVEPADASPVRSEPSLPKAEYKHDGKPFTLRPKEPKEPKESKESKEAETTNDTPNVAPQSWVVFCNHCDQAMENEHFHCSICESGDYDLCPSCVNAGVHCPGYDHWMVKRFVVDGLVENSTTERVAPKPKPQRSSRNVTGALIREFPHDKSQLPSASNLTHLIPDKVKPKAEQGMPGAFMEEKQPVVVEQTEEEADRTCNCCVKVLPEKEFVTCKTCDDYDLCIECHVQNRHGHHPGHAFGPATDDTPISALAKVLCKAGRNVRHNAVCDGCEKYIYGVRHKCLNCPDWDYCSECIQKAGSSHPHHRFVPIYDPLSVGPAWGTRHCGIYCDGPLCKNKNNTSYIEGVRYKCAVCHDTDFCANCEAHPTNKHNHTHPLIKLKTPVRNVSVTTMNENKQGDAISRLGDQLNGMANYRRGPWTEHEDRLLKSLVLRLNNEPPNWVRISHEIGTRSPKQCRDRYHFSLPSRSSSVSTANAATQVQTIVDIMPKNSQPKEASQTKSKIEIRDLLAPTQDSGKPNPTLMLSIPREPLEAPQSAASPPRPAASRDTPVLSVEGLDAKFVRDTIADQTEIGAGMTFVQTWTVRNTGPAAWPAGCSVRFIGGDNMLNLENTRALSQSELDEAYGSNVVDRPVETHEEISFRVTMKAGLREGTAISYWRLKTPSGVPFGDKLWCDIQVVSPTPMPAPKVISPPKPASAPPSSYYPNQKSYEAMNKRLAAYHASLSQEKRASPAVKAMNKHIAAYYAVLSGEESVPVTRAAEERSSFPSVPVSDVPSWGVSIRKSPVSPEEKETAELPVEEKPEPAEAQADSSGMIFPKLDKESPASSTHEAVPALVDVALAREESPTVGSSEQDDDEFFEDAESIEIRSFSSGDDDESFMTDEEYDILDASDEEAT